MRSDTFCICCPQLLQKTWARVPHHFGHTAVAPLTSPTHCTSMPTSWPPTCPSRPQRPALLTRPQCQGSMRWVKMSCDLGSFCFFISWAMASVPLLSCCLSWPPSPATPEIQSCVVLPPRVFLGRSCTAARSFGGTIVVVIVPPKDLAAVQDLPKKTLGGRTTQDWISGVAGEGGQDKQHESSGTEAIAQLMKKQNEPNVLINMDAQCANVWGNPLDQATKRHLNNRYTLLSCQVCSSSVLCPIIFITLHWLHIIVVPVPFHYSFTSHNMHYITPITCHCHASLFRFSFTSHNIRYITPVTCHCYANNLPSTEQAVKTKPKQDKSFSLIFIVSDHLSVV